MVKTYIADRIVYLPPSFEVPIPFAAIPDAIESTIRTFIADFPNKQKFVDADTWEGFEFEL